MAEQRRLSFLVMPSVPFGDDPPSEVEYEIHPLDMAPFTVTAPFGQGIDDERVTVGMTFRLRHRLRWADGTAGNWDDEGLTWEGRGRVYD